MILDRDDIVSFLDKYDKETKAIKDEILRQCWFMRGGLTYTEAMNLSVGDRELINKIIEDNMETTKKSGLPFF